MLDNSQQIWVDLTHLRQWQGRFTGIERVEYQLAIRFAKQGAKFFVYDEQQRIFKELPASALDQFATGIGQAEPGLSTNLKLGQRLTPAIRRMIPKRLRSYLKQQLMMAKAPLAQQLIMAHPFKPGDVVFVAATFSNISFLTNLIDLRKHVGIKLTHLVHDIVPIVCPQFVDTWSTAHFENYYTNLLPNVDGILAISESTRRDLESFCKQKQISLPPITVVREGDDFKQSAIIEMPAAVAGIDKFILCVGTFEVRKNYTLLYYAYKQAARQGVVLPKLVIAGRLGWLTDDIRHIISLDPEISSQIVILGGVDDKNLTWLYQNCLFTIQPTFYEGWGLPVAESLFYGKLCLSADIASMPEVGGALVDYFSPYNPKECLDKIIFYNQNSKALQAKEQAIKRDYKPTTWDETQKQVKDFLSAL